MEEADAAAVSAAQFYSAVCLAEWAADVRTAAVLAAGEVSEDFPAAAEVLAAEAQAEAGRLLY